MAGVNRFGLSTAQLKAATLGRGTCVFISHRQADTQPARAIADFLLVEVGIDVYFDAHDTALNAATAAGDDALVVDFIELGLDSSTHLLGVLSNRTRGSWWVPFEIGSARGRGRSLAHVVLDDVQDLPSYLSRSHLLVDQHDLRKWATELKADLLWHKSAAEPSLSAGIPRLRAVRFKKPTLVAQS